MFFGMLLKVTLVCVCDDDKWRTEDVDESLDMAKFRQDRVNKYFWLIVKVKSHALQGIR